MRVEYTCLCCEGQHIAPNHSCLGGACVLLDHGVKHFDWCIACRKSQMQSFEAQFVRKLLPKARLRVE